MYIVECLLELPTIIVTTRSGPKIPAAGLFGGRLYFGFGESRDNSFGFELHIGCFFAN